jgi:hypothetical protein
MNSPVQANDADVGETPLIDRSSYSQRHFSSQVDQKSRILIRIQRIFRTILILLMMKTQYPECCPLEEATRHPPTSTEYAMQMHIIARETTMMRTAMLRPWARAPVAVSIPSVMSCQPPVVIAPPTRAFASVKHKKLIKVVKTHF